MFIQICNQSLSSSSNKAILSNLYKPSRGQRKVLFLEQWNTLYPSPGSSVVSSADLDVTLMVCLLRNLPPNVSLPASGFDALPQRSMVWGIPQDVTDAADAKSKCLDYNTLKKLVNFDDSIQRNVNRLNDHSNELAVHISKIITLETNVEYIGKGTILFQKNIS
ncbi:unnamed protein product [Mytilus edulis]|uniref:DZIP3-like HEPN domain-containing protein n=1 Tax=Mytilus edulis TaxID=6550 RepID=A0A8S3RQ73_MYTED|nr:unnamed protein product [Mytilus edulis]